jgi:diguanylate cyclase (GGDEF)-like protein
MSLRIKLIIALLSTSLLSVAVMWGVAYERLERRFGDIVETSSARNFRGDVAAYWLTYGSWQAGIRAEPFMQFVGRRKALLAERGIAFDTGDDSEAEPLTPRLLRGAGQGAGPDGGRLGDGAARPARSGPPEGNGSNFRPPFRFTVIDLDGFVLNRRNTPPSEQRQATPEERQKAKPIRVKGEIVAYALTEGDANYSATDLAYRAAMENALAWGIGAAALMTIAVGLLAGRQFNRSITPLLRAIATMGDGAVRQEVPVTSRDEIGLLAQAFNRMSEELARSNAALHESYRQISAQAQQLYEVSIRDGLTGLYNRHHFDAVMDRLIVEADHNRTPLALAIADVDFFKRINDEFSHATGDAVLRALSALLSQETRTQDVLARYGGEEFVIAFPYTDLATATALCERLRQTVEARAWDSIVPNLRVTLSFGVSLCGAGGSLDEMLKTADRCLYRAKGDGRNRVCAGDV